MLFPEFIHTLQSLFSQAGHDLYAVGGCVRDQLLDRPVTEYDLTTDALPETTKRLTADAQPDALYTLGEKFGTIGAAWGVTRVEITTYRGEQYEHGSRKPDVQFSATLEQDLARRDFTINAIATKIDQPSLIDPHDGRHDLDHRLLRAVGLPSKRFRDDPLRLLRAARFASTLDFRIEQQTEASIRVHAGELQLISRERVRDEMSLMLVSPAPDVALQMLSDLGLLQYIVPELIDLRVVETGGGRHKDIFAHTLKVVRAVQGELVCRWAAALHDAGKARTVGWTDGKVHFNGHEQVSERIARRVLTELRYDRPTVAAIAKVVGMHTHTNSYHAEWTDGAVRRFVRDAGDQLNALLELSRADITSYHTYKRDAAARRIDELARRIKLLEDEASVASLRPPLDGHDLMRMFDRPPGPWIKPLLGHLLDLVIDGELAPDDQQSAETIVRERASQEEGGFE
ncbi:MAG: CCA tRNA nucleotidyltransferase [Chloroflexota bacterium]|nr:CCA tRNA nucleotidyltransferase [Chloroflexota bacterium]